MTTTDFWAGIRVKPRMTPMRVGQPILAKYGVTIGEVRDCRRQRATKNEKVRNCHDEILLAMADADIPAYHIAQFFNAPRVETIRDAIANLRGDI